MRRQTGLAKSVERSGKARIARGRMSRDFHFCAKAWACAHAPYWTLRVCMSYAACSGRHRVCRLFPCAAHELQARAREGGLPFWADVRGSADERVAASRQNLPNSAQEHALTCLSLGLLDSRVSYTRKATLTRLKHSETPPLLQSSVRAFPRRVLPERSSMRIPLPRWRVDLVAATNRTSDSPRQDWRTNR